MTPNERRQALIELLCQRRHDTYENLANEFGVSKRTIRYDIETLTLSYPIETVSGRYGGGVKVAEWYLLKRKTLKPEQSLLLIKISKILDKEDLTVLNSILSDFGPY